MGVKGENNMETGSKGGRVAEIPPMEIQNFLKNVNFPIKKDDLIKQARNTGAIADALMENLGMLPDKEYANADEIIKELERV